MRRFDTRSDHREIHRFRLDRNTLRAGIVIVLTLLGLAVTALTLPRSGALIAWASALVSDLLT